MTNSAASDLFDQACALRDRGEFAAAIDAFRRALKVDPNQAGAWCSLGVILKDEGELLEGIACLRKATELKPNRDIYSACLYFALIQAARYDEAHAEAVRFIGLVNTQKVECAEDIRGDLQAMVDEPDVVKALFQKERS